MGSKDIEPLKFLNVEKLWGLLLEGLRALALWPINFIHFFSAKPDSFNSLSHLRDVNVIAKI